MAYNSSHTGAQIDAAVSAVRQKETTWDNKLDKSGGTVTGTLTIGESDSIQLGKSAGTNYINSYTNTFEIGLAGTANQRLIIVNGGYNFSTAEEGAILAGVANPVSDRDAVPKIYLDDALDNKLDKTGGTVNGNISFMNGEFYATMGNASPGGEGIPTEPTIRIYTEDGEPSISLTVKPANITIYDNAILLKASNSSQISLYQDYVQISNLKDPVDDADAANKQYVDDAVKPLARSVTLSTTGWSDNTQTVSVPEVVADETAQLIMPMPASSSKAAYDAAGIQCTGQAANSLTFSCTEVPTSNITVYVVIQDVNYSAS